MKDKLPLIALALSIALNGWLAWRVLAGNKEQNRYEVVSLDHGFALRVDHTTGETWRFSIMEKNKGWQLLNEPSK